MKKFQFVIIIAIAILPVKFVLAISPEDSLKYINWQNLDPEKDKSWGISTDAAYQELLKNKTSHTVVVAVIDNGVDISHEDLKNHIWVNEDEIPGNGIDDDNNGYIDDINGWNFLGNSKGENVDQAPLEVTRLYSEYLRKLGDYNDDTIQKYYPDNFNLYKKVSETFIEKTFEVEKQKAGFDFFIARYKGYDSLLKTAVGKETYTDKEIKDLKVEKKTALDTAKRFVLMVHRRGLTQSAIDEADKYFTSRLDYHYNPDFCSRTIIGDNSEIWSDTAYGNNNVSAGSPDHGTMVSGIICADRNNNIGIKGVAENVKIMAIRCVPDGDEWDKDVAKSIEYAINNGAEIINMSFGKSFSPQKEFVDKIVKIADEHNVLLVHAAGNDNENMDVEPNYPSKYSEQNVLLSNNWLTVGSTSKNKKKKEFVSSYSNYGKNSVDLFAPGEDIITCTPGNKYDMASGTSFSAPVVSGAAALIKSYYPNLTATEIKDILLQSSSVKDAKVLLPGTEGKNKQYVKFSTLSVTGGVVNVYKALQIAESKSVAK